MGQKLLPSPHSQIPSILNKLRIKVYTILGKVGQIYGVSRQIKPQRRQINVSKVKNKTPLRREDKCPTGRNL